METEYPAVDDAFHEVLDARRRFEKVRSDLAGARKGLLIASTALVGLVVVGRVTREGPPDSDLDYRQVVFVTLGLGFGVCWLTAGKHPVRSYATAFALVLAGISFMFLKPEAPNTSASDRTSPLALALWGSVMFGCPLWGLLVTSIKAALLERKSLMAWPIPQAWEVWQASPATPQTIDRVAEMLPPGSRVRAAVEAIHGPGAWAQERPQWNREPSRRWKTLLPMLAFMAVTGVLLGLLNTGVHSAPILALTVASIVAIYAIVAHMLW